MNKWIIGLAVSGCILMFSALALGEPTVSANGYMEVMGSTGSKGISSLYSTADLNLDIDFSDYISAVVETRGVSSNGNSAMNVRQGYFVTGRLNGIHHSDMGHDVFSSTKELFKTTEIVDKTFANTGFLPFPENKSNIFEEKDNQKDAPLHALIFADLQNRCIPKKETKIEAFPQGNTKKPNPWLDYLHPAPNKNTPATIVVGHWVNEKNQ